MPIPLKWWVHILPGFITIVGFSIGFLRVEDFMCLYQSSRSFEIASSAIVAAISYVVGYSLNVFCVEFFDLIRKSLPANIRNKDLFKRPEPLSPAVVMRFEQYANPELVRLLYEGYEQLVFNRSLLASFIVLDVAIVISHTLEVPEKLTAFIALISITFALGRKWRRQQSDHDDHMAEVEGLVKELTISK